MFSKGSEHLNSNGESYKTHASFAFKYGWKLLVAGFASFIHGVFPGVLQYYSAGTVIHIFHIIETRNRPGENSGNNETTHSS